MTSPLTKRSFDKENLPYCQNTRRSNLSNIKYINNPLCNFPIKESKTDKLDDIHYVLSNETEQNRLLDNIRQIPNRPNGIHFGFACWLNFDLIALKKSTGGVICDINEEMISLLDLMKDAVLNSQSRNEFIDLFWQKLTERLHEKFIGILCNEGCLDKEAFRARVMSSGWLSCDEFFYTIKTLYQKKLIIHRVLDIVDQNHSFSGIKAWLIQNNLAVDTLYISNIPEWILYSGAAKYQLMTANLQELIDPRTIIINAWKDSAKEWPKLRYDIGKIPHQQLQAPKKPLAKRITTDPNVQMNPIARLDALFANS